jgi:hypothetical protein
MVRVLVVLIGAAGAALIALTVLPHPRGAAKVYTVAQLAHALAHHRRTWEVRTIMIDGRAIIGSSASPAPGSTPARPLWEVGGLGLPQCSASASGECRTPLTADLSFEGPLSAGSFVNVRLVPATAHLDPDHLFAGLKSIPGIWLKVYPPPPSWLDQVRGIPFIGRLLPHAPQAPHIHWDVSAIYRIRIHRSCTAFICDDAILTNTTP